MYNDKDECMISAVIYVLTENKIAISGTTTFRPWCTNTQMYSEKLELKSWSQFYALHFILRLLRKVCIHLFFLYTQQRCRLGL